MNKRKNWRRILERKHIHNAKRRDKRESKARAIYLHRQWKHQIKLFPQEIQRKICILTWRFFWREFIPITAKVPSWQIRANAVTQELWLAREKNIHFSHLSFNCIPENKKWIMGCQCDSCLNDTEVPLINKHCHSLIQYRNPAYFADVFMPSEFTGDWNDHYSFAGPTVVKVFDPLCDSYKERSFTRKLRTGETIAFETI